MLHDARQLLRTDLNTLVREACGLAGVCVAIVAALFLPVLI
jgi:hypothetical protein